jgi:hypothetical protein
MRGRQEEDKITWGTQTWTNWFSLGHQPTIPSHSVPELHGHQLHHYKNPPSHDKSQFGWQIREGISWVSEVAEA